MSVPLRVWNAICARKHWLFWTWNAVFLVFVFAGLLPLHLADLLREARTVPPSMLVAALALLAVPVASVAAAVRWLRRDSDRLLALFYGVEVPLLLAALLRLFLLRDLNPATTFLLIAGAVGIAAFAWQLRARRPAGPVAAGLELAGQAVCLLGGAGVAAFVLIYAVPLAALLAAAFFSFDWVDDVTRLLSRANAMQALFGALAAAVGVYSATLFCALPVALAVLYVRAFVRGAKRFSAAAGAPAAAAIVLGVAGGGAALHSTLCEQPQVAALERLSRPPRDDEERRDLLRDRERLRAGLLNAFLARERYPWSRSSYRDIERVYERELHAPRALAHRVQQAHDWLAQPVRYDGDVWRDREQAQRLYAEFFDEPIHRGERDAVRAAYAATWDRGRREAGLLAIDERKVWVARQEVTVEPAGDFADVSVREVYENRTEQPQEILYAFSLPESAVVTGLWLVDAEGTRFPFTVSPRGAAQKVYQGEVRRGLDPALLEQVGPRQYRLRVFPVPARPRGEGRTAPPLEMILRYRAFRDAWGGAPLPVLFERRNVYTTGDTQRQWDRVRSDTDGETWLPPRLGLFVPMPGAEHVTDLPGGARVRATPTSEPDLRRFPLARDRRLAVVLDRSFSMERRRREVAQALEWMRARVDGAVHVYLTSAPSRNEPPRWVPLERVDAGALLFLGGQPASDLITQFQAARARFDYEAVLVLTDDAAGLPGARGSPTDLGAPLLWVHLGDGRLAPGCDDATLATVQRRGGSAFTSVAGAFAYLAAMRSVPDGRTFAGYEAGRLFTLEPAPSDQNQQFSADAAFAPLAARQFLKVAARAADGASERQLDELQLVAREHGIVSPYSSMIVLVDDAQRAALAAAEQGRGRFSRDSDDAARDGLVVVGTPEPATWLLLALAAAAAFWLRRQRAAGAA